MKRSRISKTPSSEYFNKSREPKLFSRSKFSLFLFTTITFFIVLGMIVSFGSYIVKPLFRDKPHVFLGDKFPNPELAPNLSLIDQNHQPFQLDDCKGKVVLFTFGFTNSPTICPTLLANMNQVYKALKPEDQARVQVVFVGVDTRRDTPEALKRYVEFYNPTFLGATSTPDQIARATKNYGAFVRIQPIQGTAPLKYDVVHSAYVYVINPEGKFVMLYQYEQMKDVKRVAEDIHALLL